MKVAELLKLADPVVYKY